MLDTLAHLVDKSLVITELRGEETRYGMLETIREYAFEKLREAGEVNLVHTRHSEYFVLFAEQAEPHLKRAEQLEWLERLDWEIDNLRAALEWADGNERAGEGLKLVSATQQFWEIRGNKDEAVGWLEKLLPKYNLAPPAREYAKGLCAAANLGMAGSVANQQKARQRANDALALFRQWDDKSGVAETLFLLAGVTENGSEQYALLEQSLAASRAAKNEWLIAWGLDSLGARALDSGEIEKGQQLLNEALGLFREIGDRVGIQSVLHSMTYFEMDRGHLELAEMHSNERRELCEQLGFKQGATSALNALVIVNFYHGRYEKAGAYAKEALQRWEGFGTFQFGWVHALGLLGVALLHSQENTPRARELISHSLEMAAAIQNRWIWMEARYWLGHLELCTGEFDQAQIHLRECLEYWRERRQRLNCAETIMQLGAAAAQIATRDANRALLFHAAQLFGAAEGLYAQLALWLPTFIQEERDKALPIVRASLGEQQFEMAWDEGRALTMEQAIELALSEN